MTAILGLQSLDGVLMMADTEESLGGYSKSECQKLCYFLFPSHPSEKGGTVVTGGAGDSHLIECANQQLQRLFLTQIQEDTDISVALLNNFASNFFEETMRGYQGLPAGIIPRFQMLIGISIKPNRRDTMARLFYWKDNRVLLIPAFSHTAIGRGVAWLHPMLTDLKIPSPQECMLFHGMRMMFYAKRALVGVGGRTEVIALQNDGATCLFRTDHLKKIEDLVINYERFKITALDNNVATTVAGDPQNQPELHANVESQWSDLAHTFKQYRQQYRQMYKDVIMPSTSRTSGDQH